MKLFFIFSGSYATVEENSNETPIQELHKTMNPSNNYMPILTSGSKKNEKLVVPNLIMNNQYSEKFTNDNVKIVLETQQIVKELEIHSVIKNRCIQTSV